MTTEPHTLGYKVWRAIALWEVLGKALERYPLASRRLITDASIIALRSFASLDDIKTKTFDADQFFARN